MQNQPSPNWDKLCLILRWPLRLLTLSLVVMGVLSKRGYVDWRRIVHQNEAFKLKTEQLTEQKIQWEANIQSLLKNPDEQERVVRRVLGYVKPNEVIIEFP